MTDNIENNEIRDISELMDIPEDYYKISIPKLNISRKIKEALDSKKLSVRQLAKNIGLKHPQIIRVTSVNNYNIDTLLRILDGLDLEIEIKPRKKS